MIKQANQTALPKNHASGVAPPPPSTASLQRRRRRHYTVIYSEKVHAENS